MSRTKYTKELLQPYVEKSTSMAQLIKTLGLIPAGGNYTHLTHLITKFDLDTCHWTGQGWNKGKSIKEFHQYKKPTYLKNKLIKVRGHFCEKCGLSTWLDEKIKLELHHINSKSNELENLQLLCPNCHSFTDNYKGKNIGK